MWLSIWRLCGAVPGSRASLIESDTAARLTLAGMAIYPNQIAYSSLLSTEILFFFLLLATVLALVKQQYWWGGLVFAYACLVKPLALFVPIVVFLIYLRRHLPIGRLLSTTVVVYGLVVLVVVQWLIRNYDTTGQVMFISSNAGANLFIGNNIYATGGYLLDERANSLIGPTSNEVERDERQRVCCQQCPACATSGTQEAVAPLPHRCGGHLLG